MIQPFVPEKCLQFRDSLHAACDRIDNLDLAIVHPVLIEHSFSKIGKHSAPGYDTGDMVDASDVGCVAAAASIACYLPFLLNKELKIFHN